MNITHVISSIDPAFGGPQSVVLRMAAAQCALGHKAEIISYAGPEITEKAFRAAADTPGVDRIRWHLLPDADRLERVACIKGSRLVKRLLRTADFVHLHGVWEPILLRAATVAKRFGIPYCVCPHGMLDTWSMAQKAWKKRLALFLGYRAMLEGAKFIQALNADEARLMQRLHLKSPAIIIPNGIFPQEFEQLPEVRLFREQIGISEDRRFVLFLSRLHFKKGLDILAEAFATVAAECPDVDLIVAGPDGGARDEFQRLVRHFGIEHRVRVIGPIYGSAKLQALSAAAAFCLPSRQEGFSMAITEALACSVPVVISDACHFPEVAEASAGIVTELDPSEISRGLTTILASQSLAKTMGANGRRLVMENFTWPVIAEKTINSYFLSA